MYMVRANICVVDYKHRRQKPLECTRKHWPNPYKFIVFLDLAIITWILYGNYDLVWFGLEGACID